MCSDLYNTRPRGRAGRHRGVPCVWLSAEPPPFSFVRRSLACCVLQNGGGVFSEASVEIIWTPLRPIHKQCVVAQVLGETGFSLPALYVHAVYGMPPAMRCTGFVESCFLPESSVHT